MLKQLFIRLKVIKGVNALSHTGVNIMNTTKQLSAVITCGDWLNFENEIRQIDEEKIEYIHVDIMDGLLVPNYMIGTDMVKILHKRTNTPLDIHLMAIEPEEKIAYFELKEHDLFSFHLEKSADRMRCIDLIHDRGAKAGISLSPQLAVEEIIPYLPRLDFINIMCVKPGFPGQKVLHGSKERIREVYELIKRQEHEILIEVDGNVSYEHAAWMSEAGANIFAAGSSSIYHKGDTFHNNVVKMRNIICKSNLI